MYVIDLEIASQEAGRARLSTACSPQAHGHPIFGSIIALRNIFTTAFGWLLRRHLRFEAVAGYPFFPACCQLLPGSLLSVLLHNLLAALGPVVHRDVVVLAHTLRLPDAGKWKHPEDIVNGVQKASSKDVPHNCITIWLATEKKI